MGRSMILLISHDVIGKRMAGPGIRYFHLARVLAREFRVTLAVPEGSEPDSVPGIRFVVYASGEDEHLQRAIREARVIVVPAIEAASIPALRRCDSPIVVDGYDPYVVESLHLGAEISGLQNALSQAYLLGDFFICASERQRLWWLGLLALLTMEEEPTAALVAAKGAEVRAPLTALQWLRDLQKAEGLSGYQVGRLLEAARGLTPP